MFSKFLLIQIELKKVTLHDLSKAINIDVDEIESWLNNESLPSYIGVIELTKFFEEPVNYWFSGDRNISEKMSKDQEIEHLREEIQNLTKKSAELELDLHELIKQHALLEKVSYLKRL